MAKLTKRELTNIGIKYSAALSIKSSEGEIQWNRYNAMLIVNTIIFSLIGLSYSTDYLFPDLFKILIYLIPFFGLLLCQVWYTMTERGFVWTHFWIKQAYDLEKDLPGGINPVTLGKDKRNEMGQGVTKKYSLWIINGFSIIYLTIFLYNLHIFIL